MLDISIKNVNKMSKFEKEDFVNHEWLMEEKYDGVKITLVRNNEDFDPNDYTKNWILAYKGFILYPFEAKNVKYSGIKIHSIGISQYKLIHEHLEQVHKHTEKFPKNTEFFIEFLIRKPTITRNYFFKHGLVLLAYSPTEYLVSNGKLETWPTTFKTFLRNAYAKLLDMYVPEIVGALGNFNKDFSELNYLLEKQESSFGGKIEGIVFTNEHGKKYKLLQPDQHDKSVRNAIKNQFKMESVRENFYYTEIHDIAELIVVNNLIKSNDKSIEYILKDISDICYTRDMEEVKHDKKNNLNKQDDLYLTAKNMLIKRWRGNNWCLFIGKFRILTNAHYKIIKECLEKYDGIVIGIVSSKDQQIPKDIREMAIRSCFIDKTKNMEFLHLNTGNLITAFNKASHNINAIICGSDREITYKAQLKRIYNFHMEVIIYERDDISASKLISALTNGEKKIFLENTPLSKEFYDLYRKLPLFS